MTRPSSRLRGPGLVTRGLATRQPEEESPRYRHGSIQRDELPRRRMLLPTTTRSPQPYGFFIIIFGSSPTGKNFFAFFQAKTKALTPAYAKIIYIQKLSTIEKEIITE
ncbi:hypothetical protein RUM44_003755 [Polyplax serrata]|uniref:Uncharacterized protein n=1 Tax=Polyplax serrata TaxID=468196 RepID=A0ABR1AHC8_POLSC